MAKSKPPRKKYRPVKLTPGFDPVHAAIVGTAVFEDAHAAERNKAFRERVERACDGTATTKDWHAILFAWHVVNHMACIPGVMTNGKEAGNMLGEMLVEVAARYDQGQKELYQEERDLFLQFVELYEHLTHNVPMRIWAVAEIRATEHQAKIRRQIANEDREALQATH